MTDREIVSLAVVYDALRVAITDAGSQAAFAEQLGISAPYVSQLVNAQKPIPAAIVDALGFEQAVVYRRKK